MDIKAINSLIIKCETKLMNGEPDEATVCSLAELYCRIGRRRKAIMLLDEKIPLFEDQDWLNLRLAQICLKESELEKAEKLVDDLIVRGYRIKEVLLIKERCKQNQQLNVTDTVSYQNAAAQPAKFYQL